jgi:hypothetical protein
MINKDGFPVTSKRVDTELLHPRFKERLHGFFQDPRIKPAGSGEGYVSIVSAGRSYAKQRYFYDNWRAGKKGFNLAANPDRVFGANNFWRGSWHMQQADSFCYAVDFRNVSRGRISNDQINDIATEWGIVPTIKAKEWWHHQPRNGVKWFDAPRVGREDKLPKAMVEDSHAKDKALLGNKVLRRRSRGEAVKALQRRLGELGIDSGSPDGIFGRKTTRAVKAFQRRRGLKQDGLVGRNTWRSLWEENDELED